MRILEVHLPENLDKRGLRKIDMSRLGPVVVLAGANGAGKTRLLDLLVSTAAHHQAADWVERRVQDLEGYEVRIRILEEQIAQHKHRIEALRSGVKAAPPTPPAGIPPKPEDWPKALEATKVSLAEIHKDLTARREERNRVIVSPDCAGFSMFKIQFDHSTPSDPQSFNLGEVTRRATGLTAVGSFTPTDVLCYIKDLQDQWREATHSTPIGDRAWIEAAYRDLQDAVERTLDTKLGRDDKRRPTIFKMSAASAELSEGQKILLQLAVRLHAQGASMRDHILVLDVPETHLHPKALLDFISQLRSMVPDGQLWIATHSVHLLAAVDPAAIWYMERGSIKHAGTVPEAVLQGLIGDDQRVGQVHDLLSRPAAYASARFALECLGPPPIADHATGDKQMTQIQRLLDELLKERGGQPLRVLDYGAGKGRLLSAMLEHYEEPSRVAESIDYFALEHNETAREELVRVVSQVFEDSERRILADEQQLSRLNKQTVDVAVFCNVMHEIRPADWIKRLGPSSALRTSLKNDGFVLLVEDERMPRGEKAHSLGFLVLPEAGVRELFKVVEEDRAFRYEPNGDKDKPGRLAAFLIPAENLGRVDKDSRSAALIAILEHAKSRCRELRASETPTYRDGLQHALFAQLHINAQLAIDEGL
ncbi:MAG: ATP-binding protein [Polyangiaceae bacterium]|jgi:predicted ATPase/SAM-dependent methyltransferase|nr:ATP-binding protein [Polyangiaceae bacterium]